MQKYKAPAIILSVLLAIGLPLYSAYHAHVEQKTYPVVRFAIEPADPRDLLYGHYMTYQVKWNWKKDQPLIEYTDEDVCLCVEEGDENPKVSAALCVPKDETPETCKHVIKGQYYPGFAEEGAPPSHAFSTGVDRYYVDETVALPLERIFRDKKADFSIGLGLNPYGKPVTEKLYVDGKPLVDYIAENHEKLLAPEPEEQQTP